jgi:ABC-2 type transport system permease protein
MRTFWRLMILSFKQETTYQTAMWAGLATNLFFGLMKAAVLIALYAGRGEVSQLSLVEAITYTGLSQAMIAFYRLFGWNQLMGNVYSGQIGSDLLRPLGLYPYWMARELGRAAFNFVSRGVVFLLFYGLFFPLQLPGSWRQWIFAGLSVALGWALHFSWGFLVNLSAFWTPDAQGIGRMAYTGSQLFSGFLMPLPLFPDWFRVLSYLTPFPSMINTPILIFLGTLTDKEAVLAVSMQVGWLVVMGVIIYWVQRAGIKRLVIQGG